MASSKAWREIWVRPEVRPSRARCPSRTRVVRGRVRPRRRTLNCFLARTAHPTHANRAPRPRSPALTVPRPSLRAQVYPIWAAIGGAVSLSAFFCTRQITTSPGFRCVPPQRPCLLGCPRQIFSRVRSRASPAGSPHARHAVARASRAPRATRLRATLARSANGTRSDRATDLLPILSRRVPLSIDGSSLRSPRDAACTRTAAPRVSTRARRVRRRARSGASTASASSCAASGLRFSPVSTMPCPSEWRIESGLAADSRLFRLFDAESCAAVA